MKLNDLREDSSPRGWDHKWSEIFDHYQRDLRNAYYVRSVLDRTDHRILEIGAGSFRDMAALCRLGVHCEGIDFSAEAVSLARRRFPELASQMHVMSAFRMSFPSKCFDVSYHNGLWVLFANNEIAALAEEQARVTKRLMIVTVHNAHNADFRAYFQEMSKSDPLYDIRFFEREEIEDFVARVCTDVIVVPVGKRKQDLEDHLINHGVTDPAVLRELFRACGHRFLSSSERLMCMGTVR